MDYLKQVESPSISLVKSTVAKELFEATYESNQEEFTFICTYYQGEDIELTLPKTEDRFTMSSIANRLIEVISSIPSIRLPLFVFQTVNFYIWNYDLLILEVEHYEKRVNEAYIQENASFVLNSFQQAITESSVDKQAFREDLVYALKDKDEQTLFTFLCDNNHARFLFTLDAIDYYEIVHPSPFDRHTFIQSFKMPMEALGYNLTFDSLDSFGPPRVDPWNDWAELYEEPDKYEEYE